jgi:membrane fusion protein (multidrug efflux system)
MNLRRRSPAVVLLGVAAAALLTACSKDDETAAAAGPTPVTVVRVSAEAIEIRIEATGPLVAKERAEVAAEVSGQITEVAVEEGGAVKEGELILTTDPERRRLERASAVAVRDEARAAVRESERDFNRRKELHERNVASQTQLDQSETELTLAKSRLNAAEAQLGVADRAVRDATVRAPFSGLIAARFVSRGEYVTAGQKLFELVSLDPIEVEFRLTEADSGRVALDQKVEVRVASNPNDVFYGEVTVIAPVIDEKSRTLRVKAQIENSDARLRPGLFARIDLGLDTRENAVLVPEEAILQRADGSVVFRATPDGRVERVVIETGVVRNGRVEATRGLAAGDHIVTRGQFRLTDGQLVSSRTAEGDLVGSTAAPPPVSGSPN